MNDIDFDDREYTMPEDPTFGPDHLPIGKDLTVIRGVFFSLGEDPVRMVTVMRNEETGEVRESYLCDRMKEKRMHSWADAWEIAHPVKP